MSFGQHDGWHSVRESQLQFSIVACLSLPLSLLLTSDPSLCANIVDEVTDNETSGRGGEASTCLKSKCKILDNSALVMVKEATSSEPICRSWSAR